MDFVLVKIKHDSLAATRGTVMASECPTIDEDVEVVILPDGRNKDGAALFRLEDQATGLHYLAERGNAEANDDLVYQYQVQSRTPVKADLL